LKSRDPFEPVILGFLCNWCSYAGADLAGVSRLQYPPNVRIIRVMCSARVDPTIVLEAFIHGLDGVMVLGCHPGDCHYMTGNYQTEKRMTMSQKILEELGLSSKRLLIDWVSAAEGERFASLVGGFTDQIRELGPLGSETTLDKGDMIGRLEASKEALSDDRLRWLVGREKELIEEGNVFGERLSQEEFDRVMLESIRKEYLKSRILLSLGDGALTIKEMANGVGLSPGEVLKNLVVMERDRLISVSHIEGNSPRYRKLGG
jgi:F420-non-reducing hydrogenase iron-sulfur subunit